MKDSLMKILLLGLHSQNQEVCIQALRRLKSLNISEKQSLTFIEVLLPMLSHKEKDIRLETMVSLLRFNIPEEKILNIVNAVLPYLNSNDPDIYKPTIKFLEKFNVPTLLKARIIEALLLKLKTGKITSIEIYLVTISAFGVIEIPETQRESVARELLALLMARNFIFSHRLDIREAAFSVLEVLKVSETQILDIIETLLLELDDNNSSVRETAIKALRAFKLSEARTLIVLNKLITKILYDNNIIVREAAIKALGKLNIPIMELPKVVQLLLLQIQEGDNFFTRGAAIETLAGIEVPEMYTQSIVQVLLEKLNLDGSGSNLSDVYNSDMCKKIVNTLATLNLSEIQKEAITRFFLINLDDERYDRYSLLHTRPTFMNAFSKLRIPESQISIVIDKLCYSMMEIDNIVSKVAAEALAAINIPKEKISVVVRCLLKKLEQVASINPQIRNPHMIPVIMKCFLMLKIPAEQSTSVTQALLSILNNIEYFHVYEETLRVLATLKISEEQIPMVIEIILKSLNYYYENYVIDETAIKALSTLNIPEAYIPLVVEALLQKWGNSDKRIVEMASVALKKLGISSKNIDTLYEMYKRIDDIKNNIDKLKAGLEEIEKSITNAPTLNLEKKQNAFAVMDEELKALKADKSRLEEEYFNAIKKRTIVFFGATGQGMSSMTNLLEMNSQILCSQDIEAERDFYVVSKEDDKKENCVDCATISSHVVSDPKPLLLMYGRASVESRTLAKQDNNQSIVLSSDCKQNTYYDQNNSDNSHFFDAGDWDNVIHQHPETGKPIFTYRAYKDGREVGSASFYMHPLLCRSEDGERHNIIASTGIFSDLEVEARSLESVCAALPPTMFDKVVTSAVRGGEHGAVRGVANVIGYTLQARNVSAETAYYIQQAVCYGGYFLLRFNEYMAQAEEPDFRNTLDATLRATADTGTMFMTSVVADQFRRAAHRLGEYAQESGWTNTGKVLRFLGDKGRYGVYAYDVKQRGVLEVGASFVTGGVTQSIVEGVGKETVSYIYNFKK